MSAKDTKSPQLDLNVLENVFGTPNSPKKDSGLDVHIITNEKNKGTNNKLKPDDAELLPHTQPLLEPEKGANQPPLSGPEIDDLGDAKTAHNTPTHGIDDGLLETEDHKPDGEDDAEDKDKNGFHPITGEDGEGEAGDTEDGKWPWHDDEPDYPYDFNGIGTRFGEDGPVSPVPTTIPDVNTYQQKKNLAQGMMDLALLSANANQLRYVIESSSSGHPYYYSSITFISMSIILQIAVGIGLILNSRYNVKDEKDICKADKINNMTVLGIFLITIVNVFITSFSVAPTNTGAANVQQAG